MKDNYFEKNVNAFPDLCFKVAVLQGKLKGGQCSDPVYDLLSVLLFCIKTKIFSSLALLEHSPVFKNLVCLRFSIKIFLFYRRIKL